MTSVDILSFSSILKLFMGKFLGLVLIQPGYFSHLLKDDPVRPHLSEAFRLSANRLSLAFVCSNIEKAAVCVAMTCKVPKNEIELEQFSAGSLHDKNPIAIFYTIWSYEKGFGRKILFEAVKWLNTNKTHVKRIVTLSPKNNMARNFHTKNGAIELNVNKDSVNFEYFI